METRELEYVVAAADNGSLAKAAKSLNVSASAISRTINKASEYVGAPLFDRGSHLIPTAVGMKYIEGAREILNIKNQTYMMMKSITDFHNETLYVAMSPHIDSEIYAKIYYDFSLHFPQVKLGIVEAYSKEGAELVIKNKVSFSLGIENPEFIKKYELRFIPLQTIEYVIHIAETNAMASGGAESISENLPLIKLSKFKDVPYIAHESRAFYTDMVNNIFNEAGFSPLLVNTCGSSSIMETMIRSSNAYSIGPLDSGPSGMGLRYFRLDPPFFLTKGIYIRSDKKITAAISGFIHLFFTAMKHYYVYSSKLYPMQLELPADMVSD